jgi:hypothetical protein
MINLQINLNFNNELVDLEWDAVKINYYLENKDYQE